MRLPSLLLASLLAAACGGSDSPATEETTPSTSEPAPAAEADPPATAVPADPATGGTEPAAEAAPVDPAAPPAAITVAVQNLNRGPSGPSKKPLALTATSGTNQITVHFDNLVTYCAPEPSFTAAVEGEVLTLTLVKPNPVSRCFAPFALDAVVSLPGRNNVRKVEIAREDGKKEAASATVTAGK